jgi:Concanavalin A-like lectin/glucanases superfamily/Putative esterase
MEFTTLVFSRFAVGRSFVVRGLAMRKGYLAFLSAWLVVLLAHAGAMGLTVTPLQTDSTGVAWYSAVSEYNGPSSTVLRVLAPTNPAPGMPRRFIYVLPVGPDVDLQSEFGDGLEELRALNVHNEYNAYLIAPSFHAVPWYADHDSMPERRYESFLVRDLVPWVQSNLSVTGQEPHWLVGFSKSGFGAVTLLLRNSTVFEAAAAWDLPADQADPYIWDMLDNYGSNTNFQNNYRLTDEWVAAHRDPFRTEPRLWLSDDYVYYFGTPTFRDQVLAFAGRLLANDVRYVLSEEGATREHSWVSGWLPGAVAGLHYLKYPARDDFNRPDGGLGTKWTMDSLFGSGVVIASNQVVSSVGNGGAYYWTAGAMGPDHYSQIRITGDTGVWTGVSVRASASPSQGYWVAIKEDGAHLFSFVGGEFHELSYDATPWSTGDVLRVEAQTIAANTARLTVYRNGSVLFTHEDATYFIANGHPGIGMFATTAMALDDWEGGRLSSVSLPDTTAPGRSGGLPAGALAAGTTQGTLSLTTNENATCRYATAAGVAYSSMPNTFATTGTTAHSTTVNGLTNGGSYGFFVRCRDTAGNANTNDFTIAFSVAQPDSTPPVRSSGLPTGTLAAGTTQTTLSLTTNENATCRYATTAGVAYNSMTKTFAATGTTAHSTSVNGLTNSGSYSFFVRCRDTAGNANTNDFTIAFSVAQPDSTPPVRSSGLPTGTLAAGTTQTTLSLTTNENATCRYATTAGVAYNSMPNTFATTGTTAHSTTVNGLTGGSYSFFVRCRDAAANANTNDFSIMFSVAPSPDSGLVAAYGFNEGAGTTAVDASGHSHTAVISGAMWNTAGRFGNALSFDGVNAMVTVSDSSLLDLTTGMTLAAWVYPTAHSVNWNNVIIKERVNGEVYNLYSNTDASVPTVYVVRSAAPNAPQDARGTAQLPLNTWTHLAVTFDNATLRLYVNGVQVGSRAVAGPLLASTGALRIGGNTIWGEFFQGLIDEIRIYNRALSQIEIQTDMTRPITP